jgi:hypothetical protein
MRPAWIDATRLLKLGLIPAFAATTALAHHPVEAKFDNDRPLTFTGVVTLVDWSNPHVHIFVSVPDDGDSITHWAVELESPDVIEHSGWTHEALTPGDVITVEGVGARDRSDQAWAYSIRRADTGQRLFTVDENALEELLAARVRGPTPRWPDGQPRLGPSPGESGYWTGPGLSALVEDGVQVSMDAHGLLADIEDAPLVAPFQTWAEDLYILRQREYLADDPGFLYCMPPGGPRHFQMPFPFGVQFVEDRARGRIFVLTGGGNSNWRLIYTDGDEQAVATLPGDPLFYGISHGTWDGDTLVVRTGGFNEAFWFSNGGLPHTRALELTERISRPDANTLRYEVTIDDPGAYTRAWTSAWTLEWLAGRRPPEHFCQGNRP